MEAQTARRREGERHQPPSDVEPVRTRVVPPPTRRELALIFALSALICAAVVAGVVGSVWLAVGPILVCVALAAYATLHRERSRPSLEEADPLTGIANVRHFSEKLGAFATAQERRGEPYTVMVVDLADFKAVNDRLGHKAGDRVLMDVAAALRDVVGEWGFVGRIGGDEFAVAMPGSARRARLVSHEITTNLLVETPGGESVRLNVGSATGDDADGMSVLARALEALTATKPPHGAAVAPSETIAPDAT